MTDYPDLLTVAEVSALLRCSPKTVRRMLTRGELVGVSVGSRRFVTADSLPVPRRETAPVIPPRRVRQQRGSLIEAVRDARAGTGSEA